MQFASMSILSLFLDLSMLLMWLTDLLLMFWLEQSIVLRLEDEARWRDRRELARPADTLIIFGDLFALLKIKPTGYDWVVFSATSTQRHRRDR